MKQMIRTFQTTQTPSRFPASSGHSSDRRQRFTDTGRRQAAPKITRCRIPEKYHLNIILVTLPLKSGG